MIYDLLIIGAGPIGLATAVSAHRRGCRRIAVIDQTRAFGPAGDGVMVTQNMTRALRLLVPPVADRLCASPGYQNPFKLMNVDGKKLEIATVDQRKSPCGMPVEPRSVGAHWHGVQRELLHELSDDVMLRINSQFVGLRDDPHDPSVACLEFVEGRLRANPFAHWGNDPAAAAAAHGGEIYSKGNPEEEEENDPKLFTLRARIVIGADGINSRMRAEVCRRLGGDEYAARARARYWGFSSVKAIGKVPADAREAAEEVERLYLADGTRMCVIGSRKELASTPDAPHVMLVRLRDDNSAKYGFDWRVIVQSPIPEELARRLPEAGGHPALVALIAKRLRDADFPAALVKFVQAMLRDEDSDDPEAPRKIIVRPTYMVPVAVLPPDRRPSTSDPKLMDFTAPFGEGRVILAGDSLHGTPPFHAQGMAMGMEDVVELVDVLAKTLRWGQSDAITNPDVAMLDDIRAKYHDARFDRLARVQRDTLKRLWSWDPSAYEDLESWLVNFIPKGDGWRNKAGELS